MFWHLWRLIIDWHLLIFVDDENEPLVACSKFKRMFWWIWCSFWSESYGNTKFRTTSQRYLFDYYIYKRIHTINRAIVFESSQPVMCIHVNPMECKPMFEVHFDLAWIEFKTTVVSYIEILWTISLTYDTKVVINSCYIVKINPSVDK